MVVTLPKNLPQEKIYSKSKSLSIFFMNVLRLILLILGGWILWRFTKRWYQNALQHQQKNDATLSSPSKKQHQGAMVQCHYCGLYLPEEEADHDGKIHYCCEAHKNADQQNNP